MTGGGKGHPLPASDEARHREIPERLEREKGTGDDDEAVVQPGPEAVNPDGEPYRYDDLGRGPGSSRRAGAASEPASATRIKNNAIINELEN